MGQVSAEVKGSAAAPRQPRGAPWRALVAIDDEILRRECCRLLRRPGLQVVEACSVLDASQMCASQGADVAVLAVEGGIVTVAEVIRMTVLGAAPALVVTARGTLAELPHGLRTRAIVHPVGKRSSNEEWRRALTGVWKDWLDFLHLWRERGSVLEALRLRASLRP